MKIADFKSVINGLISEFLIESRIMSHKPNNFHLCKRKVYVMINRVLET